MLPAILARPFFNVATGLEDSELVAFRDPDPVVVGTVSIDSWSEMTSGLATIKTVLERDDNFGVQMLGGYRFFKYEEGMTIREDLVSTDTTATLIATGTTLDVFDSFRTENEFHGFEFGMSAESSVGMFVLEVLAKLAVGNIHQTVVIDGGATITTPPPGSTVAASNGGLLALPTNIGRYTQDEFSVLPEIGVNLRVDLTRNASVTIGYTGLYIDNVVRVASQIDRAVDPTQITNLNQGGAAAAQMRPLPLLTDKGMWAQGMNVGLTIWRP
jgi:hypothetical protein